MGRITQSFNDVPEGRGGSSADSRIVFNRRMDLVPGYESLMDPGGSRGRTHSGDRVVILPRRNSQEQVSTIPKKRVHLEETVQKSLFRSRKYF